MRTVSFCSKNDFEPCFKDVNIDLQTRPGNIILNKRVLLADEQGHLSHKKGEEITRFVWAKKEFLINSLRASASQLLLFIYEYKGNTSPLYTDINGNIVTMQPNSEMQGLYSWRSINIPVSYLQVGRNEIIFRSDSIAYNSWILGIENANLSDKSAKSEDSGRTWNYDLMGFDNSLKGEYAVRLLLNEYPNKGVIVSPVIDITSLKGKEQIKKQIEIAVVKFAIAKEEPKGTNIAIEVRSGATRSFSPKYWTEWTRINENFDLILQQGQHFIQWKAILSSTDPTVTPTLKSVIIKVSMCFRDNFGVKYIQVKKFDNKKIIYTSYNFIYQKHEEPKLRILRRQEKLDEVVKKANSEFEKFILLRGWVAKQWKHTESQTVYAPWDALTILEWTRRKFGHTQNNPNAFCVHFSQVYCQCCLALGLQARLVVLTSERYVGHFVCEAWSNEFEKWVMMDPDFDVHFEKDGIPLSVLELHNFWLRDRLSKVKQVSGEANPKHVLGSNWPLEYLRKGGYCYWGLILRNDQLSSLISVPVEHGWVTYHWNGFLWWNDDGVSFKLPQFSLFSSRIADFYWTLNQTTIDLYHSDKPNSLLVQLTTFTPNFDKFFVRIDNEDWREKPFLFKWTLHRGTNKLLAKVRNKFEFNGMISGIEVLYRESS